MDQNHLQFNNGKVSVCSNENHVGKFKHKHNSIDPPTPPPPPPPTPFFQNNPQPLTGSTSSSNLSSDGDLADFCEPPCQATLRYISEMLMEEDLEGKTCMLQDCLALQAAEKSFYDVLGQKYLPKPPPPPPPQPDQILPSSNRNSERLNGYCTSSSNCDSCTTANNLIQPNVMSNHGDFSASLFQPSIFDSPQNSILFQNPYDEMQSFRQLNGKVGEAINSLQNDEIVIISNSIATTKENSSSYGSRGRKCDELDDSNYLEEGKSNKHSALSSAEDEPSQMFDEVVLCNCENNQSARCLIHGSGGKVQQNKQPKGSTSGTTRLSRTGREREIVDLPTLLTVCAQAVANSDHRTASETLKQIRQHSSPSGDGTQRLAYYFAIGLETRLAGTRTPIRTHLSDRLSAADFVQGYKVYVSCCPFIRMSYFMANRTIMKLAKKATRIHIIDFGIGYGFQWPCLIQCISKRPGDPPQIHITGIDFPQPGFKPAERVEETGCRLKRYSQRFNVPFEYNAIAEKWQNIQLEDLKVDREEITVVNCMFRMRNLPDDTVVPGSPRDAVLELIKKINPDIFVHGVVNGSHNAPFFLPRFREALFHFSTLFEMFESTLPRGDQGRMLFEREVFGKNAMNVIACEDLERGERPETYKQWQARNIRAGFRPLELDKVILKFVKNLVKSNFHPDFVIDEVGQWMLQGWKGRLPCALSFWKPVQD